MTSMNWTDNQKRTWSCRITIEDAKRLKASGVDIADPRAFETIFASSLQQVEVLAELMRPQWEKLELKYEDFAELLIETECRLLEVQSAFLAALIDFFRRLGEPWMATVVEKAQAAANKGKQARQARASNPRIDTLIQKALDEEESGFQSELAALEAKLSGETSPSAPESSASTQGDGPTES